MSRIATIGFFDGVHKGHAFLFDHLRQLAQQKGLEPLIVTFDQHPREVLQADYIPQLLTTADERHILLTHYAEVLMLPFGDIQALTAEQFMTYLKQSKEVSAILMGYDHLFGSDRLRHIQDYLRIGSQIGVEIIKTGEFIDGEWHVSSTEIRQALETGNIVLANELLGRPYTLAGQVVHGNAIGRTIGFPTANIAPLNPHKIIPQNGVYGVLISGIEKEPMPAILNIGTNPTVGNTVQTIEVHIPHFEGDLYHRNLSVQFKQFIRDERRFDSLLDLRRQITEDISALFAFLH